MKTYDDKNNTNENNNNNTNKNNDNNESHVNYNEKIVIIKIIAKIVKPRTIIIVLFTKIITEIII